jgi:two-component system NtrC family sensor kinase
MNAVLIVDDSLTVRMDLREAFAQAGFDPTPCADVASARRALASRQFSLVVLDVLLPDGDGLDLLSEIKRSARHAAVPVVLLSTEAEVQDRIRGLHTGADEYVGKPYDVASVVARARELVRQAEGTGAGRGRRGPVLVVDDSLTVREELRAELERSGLEVVTAASGEEGLRVAADRQPSAVIVDGSMPGMDGASFIRQVRTDAVLRTTPCILLTASRSVGELGALDAGADAYVRKEEGHDVVLARLQALLRSSSPASPVGTSGLLSPKRILAVAFDRERSEALVERLRREGQEPVAASTVEEAMALLSVDRVDAVVVDGTGSLAPALDACGRVKAVPVLRDLPLIIVGDRDESDAVLRAIQAGADDYVGAATGSGVLRARVGAQLRRKQFEDENRFREAYAKSAAILETISDAFFAVDREWRLAYVNHAFEELLGRARAALVGQVLWDHAAALRGGPFEEELRRAATLDEPLTFEAAFPDERWFEVRAFPHEDGLSAHLRDVTERRRSQEVQAHLLGIVGHDLRTPLTSIKMSVTAVLRDADVPDRHRRTLERADAGVTRMSRLIDDLLDYSRARLGKGLRVVPAPTNLDLICGGVLDAARAAFPSRTLAYRHDGDGAGEWDAGRIEQVLLNLLTNAVRYGEEGRDITLSWTGAPDRKVISVHNHGVPIAPELLGHIFEPFKRGDAAGNTWGGVGLGLYIVKQIVGAHGGLVAVRSQRGAGTTFEVTLPTVARVTAAS